MRFRKKPVVIEAVQFMGDNGEEIVTWCGENAEYFPRADYLSIKTPEGSHLATVGDFIIKGVNGEFCPCKPDVFSQTYEEVRDA